jgi:hypothetical protein
MVFLPKGHLAIIRGSGRDGEGGIELQILGCRDLGLIQPTQMNQCHDPNRAD